MDFNIQIKKFTWRIQNFSTIKYKRLYSEIFIVDGNKWQLQLYPKGKGVDHLSIYLGIADSENLPSGWNIYAKYGFAVIDQIDRQTSFTKDSEDLFVANEFWGYTLFLALSELHNPKRGYLVNDAFLLEVYVCTHWTKGLISDKLMVEIVSGTHKINGVDCVKANEHEEPNETVAVEPKEPTEYVMKTFFTNLESKLLSSKIVFSQFEAKEAIAKLDEAFNMTPVNFYDSEKISPLKQAFKILASSSTMLTHEEKNELLAMEERLIELAERVMKAQEDKHYFTEKKLMKLTVNCNLDSNLIKYKQVESELKEIQERTVVLLAERKGIFKSYKEMKSELETLEKECVEYETKTKIADEEVKIVEAEWRRMKVFISSIREKI